MQFKAEHSIWHSCQLITLKRGNSSNSFDFKEVYSLYRFTKKSSVGKQFAIFFRFILKKGCRKSRSIKMLYEFIQHFYRTVERDYKSFTYRHTLPSALIPSITIWYDPGLSEV